MSWLSLDLATALVGFLAGFIFLFDGWKRNPKEMLPFHKTPRITGLVWVVSGGAISGLLNYFAKGTQGRAMIVYVVSFAGTLIASLLFAAIAVAVYYIAKYGRQKSLRLAMIEVVPITIFFFSNGLDACLDHFSEFGKNIADAKMQALERSRLHVLQFINDVEEFLSKDVLDGRTGLNYFRFFLANFFWFSRKTQGLAIKSAHRILNISILSLFLFRLGRTVRKTNVLACSVSIALI